mmetsp:Transcript_124/g.267  ORF Transcript_124/g.267 Transcript_124/m.267 type:complete len:660 (+) Transcript_124:142-2121(+)
MLFARQCHQVLDLASTLSDVASLAGLEQQEKRLQRIKAELSDIADQADGTASESNKCQAVEVSKLVDTPKKAPGNSKTPTLQISARDLCLNSEGNRTALNEATETLRLLSVKVQAVQSEAENAGKDAHLARTEACTAIAHAREAKSAVESHETRLRAVASECQHLRELMTDGFHRSNANAEALQRHASIEVAELRESVACLDSQVREARSQEEQLNSKRQHAWKEALSTVEELRTSNLQRHVELQEQMKHFQQQLAEQQKEKQRVAEAELKEIRQRLDKMPGAGESLGLADNLRQFQQSSATVDDMPRAWRTLLEDVVRRSQWACEETKRDIAQQMEEISTSLKSTWRGATEEHAKLSSRACQQASEAFAAAQLCTEMGREHQEVVTMRMEKLEIHVRAEMSAAAESVQQVKSGAHERLQTMQKELDDSTSNVQNLNRSLKNLEASFKGLQEVLSQTQRDHSAQRAKMVNIIDLAKGVEEMGRQLGEQMKAVKADISAVSQYSKTEITAMTESLYDCMKRVADTARHAAEQAAKKVLEASRRAAASEASAEEATSQLALRETKAFMDQKILAMDRSFAELQDAALQEVRNALSRGLEELRAMRMEVQKAAMEEARAGLSQKCDELVNFAGNLRNAALEEVRKSLEEVRKSRRAEPSPEK